MGLYYQSGFVHQWTVCSTLEIDDKSYCLSANKTIRKLWNYFLSRGEFIRTNDVLETEGPTKRELQSER